MFCIIIKKFLIVISLAFPFVIKTFLCRKISIKQLGDQQRTLTINFNINKRHLETYRVKRLTGWQLEGRLKILSQEYTKNQYKWCTTRVQCWMRGVREDIVYFNILYNKLWIILYLLISSKTIFQLQYVNSS